MRRYQISTTPKTDLPAPSLPQHQYESLSRRHRAAQRRLAISLLVAAPLLVIIGVMVGPVAARVAVLALLAPLIALVLRDRRALGRINRERHLRLQGGLADAWATWVAARAELESLDATSQARAALAANELRMQALVQSLGQAEARPAHQDSQTQAESREWIYRTAAKAQSLAAAEGELEATIQRHVDGGELLAHPEGDLDALDHAIDTARELARGVDDPAE